MSVQHNTVVSLIVHKLVKEPHGPASIELRDAVVAINPSSQRLIDHLHKLYSERPGKGYGRFEDDENNFPMRRYVRQHFLDKEIDFLNLSRLMMEHLQARATTEQLATGGYVLIAHVNNGVTDFLLAAIVTEVIGTAITDGLEIVDSVHLDMSHLRVAGRIDLTAWQVAADRYISFLKGRGEVSNYFKLFLGCNDVLIALRETQKLVEGLEQFADAQNLEPTVRDNLFEQAFGYLDDLGRNNSPISLEAVANRLWPESPNALLAALTDESLELSDGFVPDRRAIKKLVKFKGTSKHWKIEFDRGALRCGDVQYNRENDTLILANIPKALRDELLAELDDG